MNKKQLEKLIKILAGFHPQLSHPVQNTKAVQLATQRHLELYNKIAERNSNPDYALNVGHPKETAAVGMKCLNLSLYLTAFTHTF